VRHHSVASLANVSSGKTKHLVSRSQDQILPAVVLDETVSVIEAVVFDHEARRGVIQIRSTNEPTLRVGQVDLDLRPGQSCLQEQPTKPGLHRGLGRLGQRTEGSEALGRGSSQRPLVNQLQSQRAVNQHEDVDALETRAKIGQSSHNCRGPNSANCLYVRGGDFAAPHYQACS
jgi:hypothetical protein